MEKSIELPRTAQIGSDGPGRVSFPATRKRRGGEQWRWGSPEHRRSIAGVGPQTDGQIKRVNQVLEDMLRACVISFGKGWESD